ncbi:MAG: DUF2500 family protein [Bacillota bacterium]
MNINIDITITQGDWMNYIDWTNTKTYVAIFLIICQLCIILIFLRMLYNLIKAPIETVPATLISKKILMKAHSRAGGIYALYVLTFQLENGEIKELLAKPHEYAVFLEDNYGLLSYKNTNFKGFYIEKVNISN